MHPYYNNYTVNLAKQQVQLMNHSAKNVLFIYLLYTYSIIIQSTSSLAKHM